MSYGSGRVRVRSPRVRVYPFLPVKNTIFHNVGAISNVLFLPLKILLTIKVPLGNKRQKPKSVSKESDSEPGGDDEVGGLRLTVDEDELDTYGRMSFDCKDITPLHFWKDQAVRFPKLSAIARSVLAIPASQNKTEHSFSAASHVMTNLRTMLDPEHLDKLLLIRSHHKTKSESNRI